MTIVLKYFLLLIIYSFLGWVYESTLCSITAHKLINRGFLNGPICPVYGFGSLIVLLLLDGMTDTIAILYFTSALLTCTVEYIASYILEKLFATKWWDYSTYRFNINGRVCLLGAIVFGLLSVLLIEYIHPVVEELLDGLSNKTLIYSTLILFIVIMIDLFITVRHILDLNGRLKEIQEALNPLVKQQIKYVEGLKNTIRSKLENNEYYSEHIKRLLQLHSFQDARLARAFPNLKSLKYDKAWQIIKEKLLKL